MSVRNISLVISSSILVFMSQLVFANQDNNLICPTALEIKAFSYLASFPYGFNPHSKSIQMIAAAANTENSEGPAGWGLVIHPLEVNQSSSPEQVVNSALTKLTPVSKTPFHYTMIDDVAVEVCAYVLPENSQVQALAYYVDGRYDDMDSDYFAKSQSKVSRQRVRIMKMVQHVKQLVRQ